MQKGELTLRQKSGNVVGNVKVRLNFNIPEQMIQMLVNDISKAVEHWSERIIISAHSDRILIGD